MRNVLEPCHGSFHRSQGNTGFRSTSKKDHHLRRGGGRGGPLGRPLAAAGKCFLMHYSIALARALHCYPREVSARVRVNDGFGNLISGLYGGILICIYIYPQSFSLTLDSLWSVSTSKTLLPPPSVSSFLLQLFFRSRLSQCERRKPRDRDKASQAAVL